MIMDNCIIISISPYCKLSKPCQHEITLYNNTINILLEKQLLSGDKIYSLLQNKKVNSQLRDDWEEHFVRYDELRMENIFNQNWTITRLLKTIKQDNNQLKYQVYLKSFNEITNKTKTKIMTMQYEEIEVFIEKNRIDKVCKKKILQYQKKTLKK